MGRRIIGLISIIAVFSFLAFSCDDISLLQRLEEIVGVGGGEPGVDITPPGQVADIIATPGNGQITLSWANPGDEDFSGVKIIYKLAGYPSGPEDGTEIFDGDDTTYIHTGLIGENTYYYSTFAYDEDDNYSEGLNISKSPLGPEIDDWIATTAFTTGVWGHASAVCNGFIYVIGGRYGSTRISSVQYASVNSDGTIGSWGTTTPIYSAINNFSGFSHNGYIYFMHGEAGGSPFPYVRYGKVNADGTIDAWSSAADLPSSERRSSSVVYNGYAYVTGGDYNDVFSQNIYYGLIETDGDISLWNSGTPLPAGYQKGAHLSVAYNNFLYVLGGLTAVTTLTDSVLYAPIISDGSIGSWTATTSLPRDLFSFSGFVFNGYIYIIGGNDGTNRRDEVYYAKINSDGTLGAWIETEKIGTARNTFQAVHDGESLYILGGATGGGSSVATNDVQYTKLIP